MVKNNAKLNYNNMHVYHFSFIYYRMHDYTLL